MEKIKSFLLQSLFFVPILFFLVDLTRNPCYVQGTIIYIIVSLVFSLYMIQAFINKRFIVIRPLNVEVIIFLFFLVCFVSWPLAMLRFQEYRIAVYSEGGKACSLLLFMGLLVFLIPTYFFKDKNTEKKVLGALFFAAALTSIYGILQTFGIELIWQRPVSPFAKRCVATFGNPNFLSSFLVMLIPISIYKLIFNKNSFYRFVWGIITLLMLITLVCTFTRSSWLGLGVSGLFFGIVYVSGKGRNFKKFFKFFILSILVLTAFLFLTPLKNVAVKRLEETFSLGYENKAVYQRLLIWKSAKDIFTRHPVIGSGWGTFEMFFPFYQGKYLKNDAFINYRTHANNAHNEILELLAQVGVVGFTLFILAIVLLFNYVFKTFRNAQCDQAKKIELLAILTSIFAMLIDNILNVSLHFAVPSMIFWFLIGLVIKKARDLNNENIEISYNVNFLCKIGIFLSLVFFVFMSTRGIRFLLAERAYFEGARLINREQVPPSAYRKAMQYFKKSRDYRKYNVDNLYELGNVYARLGMTTQSLEAYKEAILANPGYNEIYFNMGILYYGKKDFKRALDMLKMSNRINPINLNVLYALSNVYIVLNDDIKAIEILEESLELAPAGNFIIFNNLGCLYSKKGLWDKAILNYEKSLALNARFDAAGENLELAKNKKIGKPVLFEFD